MIGFNELESLLDQAIGTFFDRDQMLLVVDANERSISHKIAEHLLRAMPQDKWNYDIDCEYNRRNLEPKRLDLRPPLLREYPKQTCTSDDKGTTVYPDIIVHQRRRQKNLLVIEIKKSTNRAERDRDLSKLMEFVRHPGYDYKFGLFLEMGADAHGLFAEAIWYHREHDAAVENEKSLQGSPQIKRVASRGLSLGHSQDAREQSYSCLHQRAHVEPSETQWRANP